MPQRPAPLCPPRSLTAGSGDADCRWSAFRAARRPCRRDTPADKSINYTGALPRLLRVFPAHRIPRHRPRTLATARCCGTQGHEQVTLPEMRDAAPCPEWPKSHSQLTEMAAASMRTQTHGGHMPPLGAETCQATWPPGHAHSTAKASPHTPDANAATGGVSTMRLARRILISPKMPP